MIIKLNKGNVAITNYYARITQKVPKKLLFAFCKDTLILPCFKVMIIT